MNFYEKRLETLINEREMSRRGFIKGTIKGASYSVLAMFSQTTLAKSVKATSQTLPLLTRFKEIPHASDDLLHVAENYRADVVIKWLDPLLGGDAIGAKNNNPDNIHKVPVKTTTFYIKSVMNAHLSCKRVNQPA